MWRDVVLYIVCGIPTEYRLTEIPACINQASLGPDSIHSIGLETPWMPPSLNTA